MEIKIGQGIGQINFGMSPEEITELLGEPDWITESEYIRYWHYYVLETRVCFDLEYENDGCSYIHSKNSSLELDGTRVIGIKEADLLSLPTLKEIKYSRKEMSLWYQISYEAKWLSFDFEYGRVESMELGAIE